MQVIKKTGSYATETHEPRQVRKEAAVSDNFRVPQGCLVGVNCIGNARKYYSKAGARLLNYTVFNEGRKQRAIRR